MMDPGNEAPCRIADLLSAEDELAALRAENERLKARGIEGMQHRIAELRAALAFAMGAAPQPSNDWSLYASEYRKAAAALEEKP